MRILSKNIHTLKDKVLSKKHLEMYKSNFNIFVMIFQPTVSAIALNHLLQQ